MYSAQGVELGEHQTTVQAVLHVPPARRRLGPAVELSATADEEARTSNELWHYAEVCRFARVMQPYMETGCVTESRVKNLPASIKARLSNPGM